MQIPRNGIEKSFTQGYMLGLCDVSYRKFHI